MKDNHLEELPLGLGMALAQNPAAMAAFGRMDDQGRQNVIERAHAVQSKAEMQEMVAHLAGQG